MPITHRLSTFMLLALLVAGCGKKAGSEADPGPNPAASSSIEGTYLVVGVDMWGKKAPDEEISKDSELDRTVKINKDKIQFKLFKRETVGYKLDPSKSPKEIDLFFDESGKKSKENYGIYKVDGDTLTLFIMGSEEPQLRPREFKTLDPFKDGKIDKEPAKQVGGFMIMTLKKVSDDTTLLPEPPPSKPKSPFDK